MTVRLSRVFGPSKAVQRASLLKLLPHRQNVTLNLPIAFFKKISFLFLRSFRNKVRRINQDISGTGKAIHSQVKHVRLWLLPIQAKELIKSRSKAMPTELIILLAFPVSSAGDLILGQMLGLKRPN